MRACFVYLIEAENGVVKIGSAVNLSDRATTIRTHSPVKTRLIAFWRGSPDDEAALHLHFQRFRYQGEWFRLVDGFAAFVESKRGLNVPAIPSWDDLSFSNREAYRALRKQWRMDLGRGYLPPRHPRKTGQPKSAPAGLTAQQARAMDFIRSYSAKHGYCPTFQEIADHLGLASKSGVARIVTGLVERGHLEQAKFRARSLTLVPVPQTVAA